MVKGFVTMDELHIVDGKTIRFLVANRFLIRHADN